MLNNLVKFSFPIVLGCVFIDQLVKYIIRVYDLDIVIINDFLSFDFTKNYGISFSMFNGEVDYIVFVSLFAIAFICYVLYKYQDNRLYCVLISLVLAGAIGNLIDRVFLGYVVDYVAFVIGEYHFAIFNFADVLLVCSTIVLMGVVYFEDFKDGNEKNYS